MKKVFTIVLLTLLTTCVFAQNLDVQFELTSHNTLPNETSSWTSWENEHKKMESNLGDSLQLQEGILFLKINLLV